MPKIKKISLGILLAVFLGVNLLGTLFLVQPARATPVEVLESIPDKMAEAADLIWTGLKVGAYSAALNTIQYVTKKLAYDSAVWLASGGKGETPFAHVKSFGDYMASVGSGAFGTFIDELGKPLGLNLCKIPDLRLDLLFRLGLRKKYFPDEPACNWENFKKGWSPDTFKSMYGSQNALSQRFTAALKPADSDLGLFITADEKLDNLVATQRYKAEKEREEGGGVKPLTDLISGNIETPAEVMNQTARDYGNINEYNQQSQTAILNESFSAGMEQLIPSTVSVFLNTLLGQMVENYFTKGMFPFGIGYEEEQQPQYDQLSAQYEATGVQFGGRRTAEKIFSSMLQTTVGKVEKYNIMGNLANCPNPNNPGIDNCAADEGIVQAVNLSNGGQTITIREALVQGYLNGEWKLLSPGRVEDNADPNCYTHAYCYRNVKLLREARVLPLGFEIAAKNSNPDNPWSLKQVVDGFDDCKYAVDSAGNNKYDANGNAIIIDDPSGHPFCHLIDPNWVIKSPPARCDAIVYNELPTGSDVPNRQQSCADLKSCVGYNRDGSCYAYGYCTREKNTWRFNLDKCDEQYRTCRLFTDASGNQAAYLYRTLNTGDCTADNAGCKAYSFEAAAIGGWAEPVLGANYYNPYVYFNSKVPQSCSAGSEGCSALKVAAAQDTTLYLRKAPYYLGCYASSSALSSIALDKTLEAAAWPQTPADLARLTPNEECKKYSQVCIPQEVGCDIYKSVTYNNPDVPGKFKPAEVLENQIIWNDQCDAKCVGYAAYREMPSNYSSGQDISYIIPSSGSVCSAQEEGCSGFTNLSTTAGGVENVEYYSYLRPCIKSDAARQKNFYTYEGSQEGGYQLKVYVLVKDDDGTGVSDPAGVAGGPKYFYRTQADLNDYKTKLCNEAKYKAGTADPDCRQFNDDAGAIYYRLLAKTIAVSDQCTPYRLNQTEMEPVSAIADITACTAQKGFWNTGVMPNRCELCYQNGEYKDGYCFYEGLPAGADNTAGISRSCGVQAESCRAYKGNAGNNVKNILSENFETATSAPAGWTVGSFVSAESTRQGGHSLGLTGSGPVFVDLVLTLGKSYDLNFWAKGSVQGLTVSVAPGTGPAFSVGPLGNVTVGDAWRSYHLGPVELKPTDPANAGATSSVRLTFTFTVSGQVFLDNLRLVEVTDYIYLVKKTLKVDPICDSNPDDNLPGEALGCAEYQNSANQLFYLTNFSYLCRENAVGCTAFLDTFNTPDEPGPRLHNVWLSGTGGMTAAATLGSDKYSCQVPMGKSGCYVNITGHTINEVSAAIGVSALVASTVYIPPDTPTSTPIYLVATKDATCNVADLGCSAAGMRVFTPKGWKYQDVTVKNDPALYDGDLCTSEAEGCAAYNYKQGNYYFKDPSLMGQKICSYRTGVKMPDGEKRNGWFWKGVGLCEDAGGQACSTLFLNGVKTRMCMPFASFNFNGSSPFCQSGSECGLGEKCADLGNIPCYPDYLVDSFNYGLWSYGVPDKYQNFVGECPAEQDGCTEYIDHNDNARAYYFLDNVNFNTAQANCNGQISQRYGCILLDNTEQPTKLWNTTSSYLDSTRKNFALIPPVSIPGGNDANIIAKVVRDRECSEWLQCNASHRDWDKAEGKYKLICDSVGRCDQLVGGGAGQGDISDCAHSLQEGQNEYAGSVLTDAIYRSRDISWGGHDYSGWSIPGIYPPEELEQVNLAEQASSSDWRLIKRIACGGVNCPAGNNGLDTICADNGKFCGAGQAGLCVNHNCVQSPNGSNKRDDIVGVTSGLTAQRCRGYPEADSPFPNTSDLVISQSFARVNKCTEALGGTADLNAAYACDCNYQKVVFGDFATKYWNLLNPNDLVGTPLATNGTKNVKGPLTGVCAGGGDTVDGKSCSVDKDCAGGTCAAKSGQTSLIGWKGFCLEEDVSRVTNADQNRHPCLAWMPIQQLTGVPDMNNQYADAGFEPSKFGYAAGPFYCLGTERWEKRQTYKITTKGRIDCRDGKNWQDGDIGLNITHPDWWGLVTNGNPPGTNPTSVYTDILQYCENSSYRSADEGGVDCKADVVPGYYYLEHTIPYPPTVCAPGYKPVNLTSFHQYCNHEKCPSLWDPKGSPVPDPCDEDEEWITMEFECQPVQGDGWYKDPGGHLINHWSVPSGWRGSGKDYVGNNSGNIVETEENRCISLYGVSANNENKAWTDRLWKNYPTYTGATADINLTSNCQPYAALGLLKEPAANSVLDLNDSCGKDSSTNRDTGEDPDKNTQKVYAGGKEHSNLINQLFAKAYSHWEEHLLPVFQSYCVYPPPANGFPCHADTDCVDPAKINLNCAQNDHNFIRNGICPTNHWGESYQGWCSNDLQCLQNPAADQDPTCHNCDPTTQGVCVTYHGGTGSETTIKDSQATTWQDVSPTQGAVAPPVIYPVIATNCRQVPGTLTEVCEEGKDPGFTLSYADKNVWDKDLVIPQSSPKVAVKFYALADKDHMPLRRIMIDWGDESSPQMSGDPSYYRNHRGARAGKCVDDGTGKNKICMVSSTPDLPEKMVTTTANCANDMDCSLTSLCVDEANAPYFSYIKDRSCDNSYAYYSHPYYCQKGIGTWVSQPCPEGWTDGCCIFHPRIQVLDNWGWCNGSCTGNGTTADRGGCYADGNFFDKCESNGLYPHWTEFGGSVAASVIVKPAL